MAKLPAIDIAYPQRIVLDAKAVGLNPDRFFELCADNPDLELELTAQKEIVIMPPAGAQSDALNFNFTGEFALWVNKDGTGVGFGSSAGFTLPNGAVRSPDGAWIHRKRWEALDESARSRFAPMCPDFVMELRSPGNSLKGQKAKMAEYIANGAQLGWLIDPVERKVYVYSPGRPANCLDDPQSISGDPVLRGFSLDLTRVWK